MTNVVFTSLPMFYLCTFLIPKAVVKQIVKYKSTAFGAEVMSKPKTHLRQLGKWSVYQKEKGGLGVLNFRTQNKALFLKYLDKLFNRADVPWVPLVWENTIVMVSYLITLREVNFGGEIF